MKNGTLKDKTFSSIAWSGALQSASQIINFCLGILLARLLTPEDFGIMATMLAFISIAQLFSDFGLSAGLIQKDSVSREEAFSCAVVNFLIGLFFSIIIAMLNSQIANFYNVESLNILVIAIAPLFCINSLCSVPQALLSRELEHKKISLIELTSVVSGTVAAVVLAQAGYGIWSLVAQQYITALLRMSLLFIIAKISFAMFQFNTVKSLFGFSASVFFTRLIQQIALQTDKVLVGKYLGTQELGFYSRAYQLTTFPINNVTRVVNNVMFPALSKIKNDTSKVTSIYLKVVGYIAVLTFPMLAGFAYLSEEIVYVLLGEKWVPMHIYFRFFSLVCMFSTLGQMSTSFFLSQGKAHLHLKLNVFTQSIKIAFLVIGVQWGGFGIMVAFAASTAVSFSSAIYLLSRFLTFNLFTFINAIKKTSIITLFMIASLFILNDLLIPFSQPVLLLFNSTVGAIIYVTLSVIIKNSSFLELTQLIFSKFFKR